MFEPLPEKETTSIPIAFVTDGKICFKPHSLSFPWTSSIDLASIKEGTQFISGKDDQQQVFHYFVRVEVNSR